MIYWMPAIKADGPRPILTRTDSDDEDEMEPICYTFPSSLHRSYVFWRLMPPSSEISYETVLQLALAVIRNFNPSQLSDPERRVGGSSKDRPPEARYQQEFYRASSTLSVLHIYLLNIQLRKVIVKAVSISLSVPRTGGLNC